MHSAYLDRDEIPRLRSSDVGASIFMDKNVENGESAIQVNFKTPPNLPLNRSKRWKAFINHLTI